MTAGGNNKDPGRRGRPQQEHVKENTGQQQAPHQYPRQHSNRPTRSVAAQGQTAPGRDDARQTTTCGGSTATSHATRIGAQTYLQQSARRYCGTAQNTPNTQKKKKQLGDNRVIRSTSVTCKDTGQGSIRSVCSSDLTRHGHPDRRGTPPPKVAPQPLPRR